MAAKRKHKASDLPVDSVGRTVRKMKAGAKQMVGGIDGFRAALLRILKEHNVPIDERVWLERHLIGMSRDLSECFETMIAGVRHYAELQAALADARRLNRVLERRLRALETGRDDRRSRP